MKPLAASWIVFLVRRLGPWLCMALGVTLIFFTIAQQPETITQTKTVEIYVGPDAPKADGQVQVQNLEVHIVKARCNLSQAKYNQSWSDTDSRYEANKQLIDSAQSSLDEAKALLYDNNRASLIPAIIKKGEGFVDAVTVSGYYNC